MPRKVDLAIFVRRCYKEENPKKKRDKTNTQVEEKRAREERFRDDLYIERPENEHGREPEPLNGTGNQAFG
ncbi:hypothetical protein LTR56_024822 [Elasticomyces elasticus]|nr:hypothetical protein LTR56_024822 [Elasticomyces elasticus]KAK3641986.1 hypothetical protein LTR22_016311 [Elasticomyces elasticus]KAK4910664.1 hypothetical protein LTR49_020699 [Elasticomyces elasticus]KAK5742100.1 hypothetical protein LTS12_024383 [Elasticomyces elasticus]